MTTPTSPADRRRGVLLATSGVLILSVDSLLVRLAGVDGGTVLFWRGALMAISLTIAAGCRDRRGLTSGFRAPLTWVIALCFTGSTAAFVLSILHTRVANTVVIISSAPLFAAFFSAWFLKERVPPRTWLAICGAIGGVLIVAWQSLGAGRLAGDLLALTNALLTGGSMTLFRRHPGVSRSLVLAASGLLLALIVLPWAEPLVSLDSLLVLLVMGLVQMPLSLVLITDATRFLPAAEVSLFLLLETLLAPLWAWWFLGEAVPASTLAGGGVIVGTLLLHVTWSLHRGGRRAPPAPH